MPIVGNTSSQGKKPTTPVIGTATALNASASVAFTPSTYIGKSGITYTATSTPGGFTGSNTVSPITVGGLNNGTAYTFTVVGSTASGVPSDASAFSNSVTPFVSYTITPSATSVNEGTTVTFNITTVNFGSGTLYWTLQGMSGTINNADFSSPANAVTLGGSVTITSNSGSFAVVLSNDLTTEGAESFRANLRTGSTAGTIVATSATVAVADTSLTPPPTFTVPPTFTTAPPTFTTPPPTFTTPPPTFTTPPPTFTTRPPTFTESPDFTLPPTFTTPPPTFTEPPTFTDTPPSFSIVAPPPVFGFEGGCFVYGTKIQMADSSWKNIEDLQMWDSVMAAVIPTVPLDSYPDNYVDTWSSTDISGTTKSSAEVIAVRLANWSSYYVINDKIKVTYEHHILMQKDNVWSFKEVRFLAMGDHILDDNLNVVEVTSLEEVFENVPTVSITLDVYDVYFVEGLTAHNSYVTK
jgi:hypothetical protein